MLEIKVYKTEYFIIGLSYSKYQVNIKSGECNKKKKIFLKLPHFNKSKLTVSPIFQSNSSDVTKLEY